MNEQAEQPAATEAEIKGEILIRRRHRRQGRRESRLQRILRRRRWEIIGGLALMIGLFLAFGPLAQRNPPGPLGGQPGEPIDLLTLYFDRIMTAISSRLDRAAGQFWGFMLLTNWAIKLGYGLLAFAIILIPLRLRWWLLNESPLLHLRCPRCGSTNIHRVHRRGWERVAAKVVPIRRYRCSECRWRGMRIDRPGHAAPSTALASSRN